jgi:hypothetical protein
MKKQSLKNFLCIKKNQKNEVTKMKSACETMNQRAKLQITLLSLQTQNFVVISFNQFIQLTKKLFTKVTNFYLKSCFMRLIINLEMTEVDVMNQYV